MNASEQARRYSIEQKLPPGETPIAIFARGLLNAENDRVITADQITAAAALVLAGAAPFRIATTVAKTTRASGSIVFSGVPVDGQIVTIQDGLGVTKVFEFDDGTAATATLTFTGVPADTGTVTLDDGTTSKVFEFDTGVAGVASTGGVITFTGTPADGDSVTLTTHGGTATTYEFNVTGSVSGSNKAVLTGGSAANAATELIAAINATGTYSGNGSTGYTASSGGSGVVNIVRTAAGASNETITKSGADITVTSSFSGGVTQVAVGSAITGGRVGVATASTPGGSALTTAQVCTNLIAAINAVSGPAFLFTATQGAGTTITLTANTKGTGGNSFTASESATNFVVTSNFGGGAAAGGGSVSGSNIAVAISTTNGTASALNSAINAASFGVTSSVSTATLTLTGSGTAGADGNIAITENATNVAATGMTGGTSNDDDLSLIAAASGLSINLTGFTLRVDGATAWNDAATVKLQDTDGNIFATIAKAALTGNAVVHPHTSGVTLGDAWFEGGAEGAGLELVLSSNEATGSDLQVAVFGLRS